MPPIVATIVANLAIGMLAGLLARSELRASPRALVRTRAFFATATFATASALPLGTMATLRYPDWTVGYVFALTRSSPFWHASLILAHPAAVLLGLAIATVLIRDHRPRWVAPIALLPLGGVLVAVAFNRRLGTVGTFSQWAGGFGTVPLAQAEGVTLGAATATLWVLASAHLLAWIHRRTT